MSAALFANSALMTDEGSKVRMELLENIEKDYEEAVATIYGAKRVEEIPMDDPLFANIKSVMDDDVAVVEGPPEAE